MLTPPDLSTATITALLRDSYGVCAESVTFLPIGADALAAVYRIEAADGSGPYFLKVRRGEFDELAVSVPAFLRSQGIRQVMAATPTATGELWTRAHGFGWILYPFFEGHNGYGSKLSDALWVAFGASMKAIHTTALPPPLAIRVPRESYSPPWLKTVRDYDETVESRRYDDPIAARFAAFWISKRDEIRMIVSRTAALAETLRGQVHRFVLCHSDLHPGNVLIGADDEMVIVDWDNPILAPKERDLICLDGGVGETWNDAREDALFYAGYGPCELDQRALAYYRYERIVADLASYGAQIFEVDGSVEDREQAYRRMTSQFHPHQVIAVAHETYRQIG